jgi:hypothetical protein
VDIYNATDGSWHLINLSVAREYLSAATAGAIVLFAGGDDFPGGVVRPLATVDILDATSDTWLPVGALAVARYWMGAAGTSVGNGARALFVGGYNATTPLLTVDVYDSTTNTWSVESLAVARTFVAVTAAGSLVLSGGGGGLSGDSSLVDVFNCSIPGCPPTVICTGPPPSNASCINGISSLPQNRYGLTLID